MKKILIVIIVLIILIIISNLNNNNSLNDNKDTNQYSNNISENLKYKNKEIEIISNKYIHKGLIELIIKNKTNKELKTVTISATCYDKYGNNLGTYSNGRYNINTTDTYKIEIYCNYDTEKYNLEIKTD